MTVYGNYDVIAFRSCIQIFIVYIFMISGQKFSKSVHGVINISRFQFIEEFMKQ